MRVNILNVNDNTPKFNALSSEGIYSFSVEEHSPNLTQIGQIEANDDDDGDYGIVKYSISSNLFFFVDSINGSVYTKADIDREIRNTISLEVTATDGGTTHMIHFMTPTCIF